MGNTPLSESAFSFDCEGARLIGVLHHTPQGSDAKVGMVTVVAGGPQYRGGCGRQLVELGRRLASEGIPVLRFDHRGIGDSEGAFLGFQHIEEDLIAAIRELKRREPTVERVILWGGCDAASAALIHAHRIPDIISIIAANPFVSSERTAARVRKKHYLSRLAQISFWRKVMTLQYNPLEYLREKLQRRQHGVDTLSQPVRKHYIDAMREGLESFHGEILFLMSGRSLISKEFDELIAADPLWQRAYSDCKRGRIEVEGADQTFSSRTARIAMLNAASDWAARVRSE